MYKKFSELTLKKRITKNFLNNYEEVSGITGS